MDPQTLGWIGGIGGSILGILGGAFGTYASLRNTAGPRERAFVWKAAAVCWAGVIAFLAALWLLPFPYRGLVWLPYSILLPLAIRYGNRRQQQLRNEEAANA